MERPDATRKRVSKSSETEAEPKFLRLQNVLDFPHLPKEQPTIIRRFEFFPMSSYALLYLEPVKGARLSSSQGAFTIPLVPGTGGDEAL